MKRKRYIEEQIIGILKDEGPPKTIPEDERISRAMQLVILHTH